MSTVAYVPGKGPIIDEMLLVDGIARGRYSRETFEEIAERYPGAKLGDAEEVYAAACEAFKSGPEEITEEQFRYSLECLPPVAWKRRDYEESFKMCERTYGSVTTILARVGRRYFSLSDVITMPHDEIIARCRAFMEASNGRADASQ